MTPNRQNASSLLVSSPARVSALIVTPQRPSPSASAILNPFRSSGSATDPTSQEYMLVPRQHLTARNPNSSVHASNDGSFDRAKLAPSNCKLRPPPHPHPPLPSPPPFPSPPPPLPPSISMYTSPPL